MSIDYMRLVVENHTGTECSCEGDTSVYENITFHGTPVSKEDLDGCYLGCLKNVKKEEIDARTNEKIAEGFTYDGHVFSASVEAQLNWMCLKNSCADFTFPMTISTLSGYGYEMLEANVHVFYLTGVGTLKALIDSGRAIRAQIEACATEAEVAAIVDNR